MGAQPHVVVDRLRVVAGAADTPIVKDVGFEIARGEVLALIGESGSGKTTIALSLMGYARPGCRIAGGSVRLGDTEILSLSRRDLAGLRGRRVSYIAQSAAGAFNPSRRIMPQVIESTVIHGTMPREAAEAKAIALFGELALPSPETIGSRFPHQVSGGQLQRLLAAMALITDPELVIMDEPTTALDVTTQIEVLRAFKKVVRERRTTAVYVSHDLAVVAQMADRIVVLRDGEMREIGATGQLLAAPRNDYTRSLLAAVKPTPQASSVAPTSADAAALVMRGIEAGYGGIGADGRPRVPVLSGIDVEIPRGTTLGVIGESGSGKSTLARVAAGLLPAAGGEILLGGEPLPAAAADRSREQLRRIQIVFQSADTALNPARTVKRILGRPLQFYRDIDGAALDTRVRELLDMVRLPAGIADRYPGELSGGQKQRVNFARALAAEPDVILCDEITSALDTVVGAAVLELLAELRRELGLSYMFISHDLSTVRAICDRIMILYAGRMVETGPRAAVLAQPRHPYTDLLISSVPELRTGWLDALGVRAVGEAAAAGGAPSTAAGCAFFERCGVALPGTCDRERPPVAPHAKGALVACHRDESDLAAAQLVTTTPVGAVAPAQSI